MFVDDTPVYSRYYWRSLEKNKWRSRFTLPHETMQNKLKLYVEKKTKVTITIYQQKDWEKQCEYILKCHKR